MPEPKIKRVAVPAILAVLVAMTSTTMMSGAYAQTCETATDTDRDGGLHFVSDPELCVDKSDDSVTLTATGEVAGAGQGAGTASLDATVSATLGCLTNEPPGNPGGGQNEPSGLRDVDSEATGTAPFTPTRQGRAEFEVSTNEITIDDFDFECPSAQQTEVIVGSITVSEITLTIEAQTGTITATFDDIDP